MKDALTRGLVGSLIILLLSGGFALAVQGYKAIVPAQVEHDTANITQTDVDQARARWEAQNVSVYEVSAADPRRNVRLRVDRAAGKIYLLKLTVMGVEESVDGLNAPISNETEAVYKAFTVDSVFDKVGTALQGLSTGQAQSGGGDSTTFQDIVVNFDPARGYPASYTQYTRTTLSPNEITFRSKDDSLELTDFTVIK